MSAPRHRYQRRPTGDMTVSRRHVAESVAATLAAEACCSLADLRRNVVHVKELVSDPDDSALRRRFPLRKESLDIISMGAGVVVSATRKWMPWVTGLFRNVQAADAFGMELLGESARRVRCYSCRLNGPQLFHVTSSQDWRPARDLPAGYIVEIGGAELLDSVDQEHFPNARIASGAAHQGRDVPVAAVALHCEEVVGVATFSTDSDCLWQMGIDVLRDHRSRGLGVALTSQAARAVLDQGKVPYYATSVANIASRRTAQSAGFYPGWTSVYTTAK